MLIVSQFCETVECYDLESNETKVIVFNFRTMRFLTMDIESWNAIQSQELDKFSSFTIAMLIKHNILINDSEDEMLTLAREKNHDGCDHNALCFVIRPFRSKLLMCEFCNTVIDIEYANVKGNLREFQ